MEVIVSSIKRAYRTLQVHSTIIEKLAKRFPGYYGYTILHRLLVDGENPHFLDTDPWFRLQRAYWLLEDVLVSYRQWNHPEKQIRDIEAMLEKLKDEILETDSLAHLSQGDTTEQQQEFSPPQHQSSKDQAPYLSLLLPPDDLAQFISRWASSSTVELRLMWFGSHELPLATLLRESPTDHLLLEGHRRDAIAWLIPRKDWPVPGSVTTITFKPSSRPAEVIQRIIEAIRKESKKNSPILVPIIETTL